VKDRHFALPFIAANFGPPTKFTSALATGALHERDEQMTQRS